MSPVNTECALVPSLSPGRGIFLIANPPLSVGRFDPDLRILADMSKYHMTFMGISKLSDSCRLFPGRHSWRGHRISGADIRSGLVRPVISDSSLTSIRDFDFFGIRVHLGEVCLGSYRGIALPGYFARSLRNDSNLLF